MAKIRVVRVQAYHPPCGYPIEVGTVRPVRADETDPRVLAEARMVDVDHDPARYLQADVEWMHTRRELADALDEAKKEGVHAPDPKAVLALPMERNADSANADTVGEYLVALLGAAWESADNIHPWGNSGWKWELYQPLVVAGLIESPFWDGDAYYVRPGADAKPGAKIIAAAIRSLLELTPVRQDVIRKAIRILEKGIADDDAVHEPQTSGYGAAQEVIPMLRAVLSRSDS